MFTLFLHYCAMSPFSTLLRHVYCFHQAAHCLLFHNSCVISTLSTHVPCLLFYVVVLCLLFQRMCHVSFFTLLCCVYFFHIDVLVLLFHAAATCLFIPHGCAMSNYSRTRCCTVSTFSTRLRHVYFFHATAPRLLLFHTAVPCLLFPHCCVMSTFFNAAAPYLLFPRCCAMSTLSTVTAASYLRNRSAPAVNC